MSRSSVRILLAVLLLALLLAIAGCQSADQPATGSSETGGATQGSPGEDLAQTKCTMCHPYDRVEQAQKDRAGWEATVDRMVQNGLVVTPDEKQQIIDYLVEQNQ